MSNNHQKGKLFVVSAPAGTGKTTLVRMLADEFKDVVQSISYTTRPPRIGEQEGIDYHFITKDEFEKKIKQEEFLEYIELYGTYYGTCRKAVYTLLEKGLNVVLVIDTQGGLNIKKTEDAVFIFIEPPSLAELKQRLILRKSESMSMIETRLACAAREVEDGKQYDYKIINDKLNDAYAVLRSIYIAKKASIQP